MIDDGELNKEWEMRNEKWQGKHYVRHCLHAKKKKLELCHFTWVETKMARQQREAIVNVNIYHDDCCSECGSLV